MDRNIGVRARKGAYPFRRCDQTNVLDPFRAPLLQDVDQLAEDLGWRRFVAQARDLLSDERVRGDMELRAAQWTAAAVGLEGSPHSRAAERRRSRSISGYTG